jgi:hypothetical protein
VPADLDVERLGTVHDEVGLAERGPLGDGHDAGELALDGWIGRPGGWDVGIEAVGDVARTLCQELLWDAAGAPDDPPC